MEKILLVFTDTDYYTKEKIINSEIFNKKYLKVSVYTEIKEGKVKPDNYDVIIDGTDGNIAYTKALEGKRGSEISASGETYIITPKKRIIVKLDNISKFFSADFNKELGWKVKEAITRFEKVLNFAYIRIPEVRNEMIFLQAVTEGIDVSSYVKNDKSKYVLIDKMPTVKEEGIVYITPGNIKLLLDFMKVKEVIR